MRVRLLAPLRSATNARKSNRCATHSLHRSRIKRHSTSQAPSITVTFSRFIMILLLVSEFSRLEPDVQKEVAHYTLNQIQPRVVSFEEQVLIIREKLAELYESEQQWSKAAQMLSGIDLDSAMSVQILCLRDDDAVNAEAFIHKVLFKVNNIKNEVLNLQYKDFRFEEKILGSLLRAYDISQIEKRQIGDEEIDEAALEQALAAAVTCTILAAAGPQRSRVLATLYKDERCSKIKNLPNLAEVLHLLLHTICIAQFRSPFLMPSCPCANLFCILVSIWRGSEKPEIDAFAEELKPHQQALLPDNFTVLDRAMIEHNLSKRKQTLYKYKF
ncbi:COP9/signalosome complex subunit Csn4 [Datura stramonium]|uniref:COP9/signalosome complex subunit Csn4 n=1 Tax=Datura stramonium TaxID=4076 RepID=A0ABS8TE19_DATST|nr:COP9/signalosome complex subunit Csn4 [Datura stramonium]